LLLENDSIYEQKCTVLVFLTIFNILEIIKSYATLARNNISLNVNIKSVTYDAQQQTCMADISQIMKPKV
jgi:hypothetical protein